MTNNGTIRKAEQEEESANAHSRSWKNKREEFGRIEEQVLRMAAREVASKEEKKKKSNRQYKGEGEKAYPEHHLLRILSKQNCPWLLTILKSRVLISNDLIGHSLTSK